jgi:hypothetical protein
MALLVSVAGSYSVCRQSVLHSNAQRDHFYVPTGENAVGFPGHSQKKLTIQLIEKKWWARQDLNLGPTDYEAARIRTFSLIKLTFGPKTVPSPEVV